MAVNGSLFDPFFSTDYCPKKAQGKSKLGKGTGHGAKGTPNSKMGSGFKVVRSS